MASSKKISMDPNNLDPEYRYKMEPVIVKYEGKANGRTVITNILNIADNILGVKMDGHHHGSRYSKDIIQKTAKHISAFIGKKISGQCQYKKPRKVCIISGKHERNQLQHILFQYVEEFARCKSCGNEELTPAVQPPVTCKSCGNDVKPQKSKSKKDKRKRKQKQKKKRIVQEAKVDDGDDDEEEVDGVDHERKAVQERIAKDPMFALNHFLKDNENAANNDIMEKIKIISLAHKLDRKQQIKMVIYCLLNTDGSDYKLLIQLIKKYSSILETFTLLNNDTQIFLAYMEEMIIGHRSDGNEDLLNHSYAIFNCLYDDDIIGEDELIAWHQTHDNKFSIIKQDEAKLIKDKAEPFIKWLQEAEDDNDSD